MSIKLNVVANYAGIAFQTLISFAFVPVYIKFLGIEAYGLIGFYTILQASMQILEFGLRPTLGREMGLFKGGGRSAEFIRNLLRSIEILWLFVGLIITSLMLATAPWLARHWVGENSMAPETISKAIQMMGVVISLKSLESMYSSTIFGLQRQVAGNALAVGLSAIRAFGAVGVLTLFSADIVSFFIWQGTVSIVSALTLRAVAWRFLPQTNTSARFSLQTLSSIKSFALGIAGTSVVVFLLMQTDKILLSKILTLKEFAHYSLAVMMANALFMVGQPVVTAIYPRLAQLFGGKDHSLLAYTFHKGAQLLTVLVGSAAAVLFFYATAIVGLWTHDPEVASHTGAILSVLALGGLLNVLNWMPYQIQLASGWTSLALAANSISLIVLIPAILYIAPRYGGYGTAWVWVVLNFTNLIVCFAIMFHRLLREEKWSWIVKDTFIPLLSSFSIAALFTNITISSLTYAYQVVFLLIVSLFTLASAVMVTYYVRVNTVNLLKRLIPIMR